MTWFFYWNPKADDAPETSAAGGDDKPRAPTIWTPEPEEAINKTKAKLKRLKRKVESAPESWPVLEEVGSTLLDSQVDVTQSLIEALERLIEALKEKGAAEVEALQKFSEERKALVNEELLRLAIRKLKEEAKREEEELIVMIIHQL